MKEANTNDYFTYLVKLIKGKKYSRLLDILHRFAFICYIKKDDDRVGDGLKLREDFQNYVGNSPSLFLHFPECSVLELLIGLSFRLEFESFDELWEKSPAEWFLVLLDNLGLRRYSDNKTNHIYMDIVIIEEIINNFINRQYCKDGQGGLFPLKNSKYDQRKVTLWKQMTFYIIENYFET